MIGDRQRHRDLTIVLLAKLAAILSGHPDRMLPFPGKARLVNDPCFDRPVAFQLWQHQFPHLRENVLVRPSSLADKMKKRSMLAAVRFGAVIAAIGSRLLRSQGIINLSNNREAAWPGPHARSRS
jgi:hypothetical protein